MGEAIAMVGVKVYPRANTPFKDGALELSKLVHFGCNSFMHHTLEGPDGWKPFCWVADKENVYEIDLRSLLDSPESFLKYMNQFMEQKPTAFQYMYQIPYFVERSAILVMAGSRGVDGEIGKQDGFAIWEIKPDPNGGKTKIFGAPLKDFLAPELFNLFECWNCGGSKIAPHTTMVGADGNPLIGKCMVCAEEGKDDDGDGPRTA